MLGDHPPLRLMLVKLLNHVSQYEICGTPQQHTVARALKQNVFVLLRQPTLLLLLLLLATTPEEASTLIVIEG